MSEKLNKEQEEKIKCCKKKDLSPEELEKVTGGTGNDDNKCWLYWMRDQDMTGKCCFYDNGNCLCHGDCTTGCED